MLDGSARSLAFETVKPLPSAVAHITVLYVKKKYVFSFGRYKFQNPGPLFHGGAFIMLKQSSKRSFGQGG